jgi:phosphoglucomutase
MSLIVHPVTGIAVGDPEIPPLTEKNLPDFRMLREAFGGLILSASGFRKVFASPHGKAAWSPWVERSARTREDSLSPHVSPADLVLAGGMAMVYARFIQARSGLENPAVLVGIDSRPTGPAIADMMIRVLVALGIRPRYLFIVAAPEIMALDRHSASLPPDHEERTEGFVYISASHNPPGHNGLKFGAGTGGVLSPEEIHPLIAAYRELMDEPKTAQALFDLVRSVVPRTVAGIFVDISAWKRRAISAYTLLAREIVTGLADRDAQENLFEDMTPALPEMASGIVAELNGSARSLSIDSDFLRGMGVKVRAVNDEPGYFVHRIVPEGESLADCARELEAARELDPSYILGYTPDCDGDRGNLVWFDESEGKVKILEAQQVFALCCVAELASLRRNSGLAGHPVPRAAIAVNDATSMRIEAIARFFGARVFRAETGEANVVGLASALRDEGFEVRILGEGSNGGNITHPSRVRDPLATLGAVLKLLSLRDSEKADGLFHIWMRLSGRESGYAEDFDLGDIIASLPVFATTSVFENRAALKIRSADKAALKSRYREIFLSEWSLRKDELVRRFGILSWKAFTLNGGAERELESDFAASGSGGLRIVFLDRLGEAKAMIWMRGSGTEAVFRILADVSGGSSGDEDYFLSWHRSMVERADAQA